MAGDDRAQKADARRVFDAGVDGLVVSNHGGRQVDRSTNGLALDGAASVSAVIDNVIAELDLMMGLVGMASIGDITRDVLEEGVVLGRNSPILPRGAADVTVRVDPGR